MIKRLLGVIIFVLYLIVLLLIFFPYLIVRGWDKLENELLDPLERIIELWE